MRCSLKDDLASAANQFALTGRPRPTRLAPSQAIILNLAGNIAVATGANRTVALALAAVRATVEPMEAEVNSGVTAAFGNGEPTSGITPTLANEKSRCRGTSSSTTSFG